MPSLFFPPNSPETALTEEEAKRFSSPEETGARLVEFISCICEEAWQQLPKHLLEFYRKPDFKKPDWLDEAVPDQALNELHRIAYQLPEFMPDKKIALSESEVFAMKILIQTRKIILAAGRVKNSETSLLLMDSTIELGLYLSKATTAPWQRYAAAQYKSKNYLIEANKGTPEGSANDTKSKKASALHIQWQEWADEIWERHPHRRKSDVARDIKKRQGSTHSHGTIRNKIKQKK